MSAHGSIAGQSAMGAPAFSGAAAVQAARFKRVRVGLGGGKCASLGWRTPARRAGHPHGCQQPPRAGRDLKADQRLLNRLEEQRADLRETGATGERLDRINNRIDALKADIANDRLNASEERSDLREDRAELKDELGEFEAT